MRRIATVMLSSFALSLAMGAKAVDGDLDHSFATDAEYPGYAIHYGFNLDLLAHNQLAKVLPAIDGKLYLIGAMADQQNNIRLSIMRSGPSGPRDYEFGEAGL